MYIYIYSQHYVLSFISNNIGINMIIINIYIADLSYTYICNIFPVQIDSLIFRVSYNWKSILLVWDIRYFWMLKNETKRWGREGRRVCVLSKWETVYRLSLNNTKPEKNGSFDHLYFLYHIHIILKCESSIKTAPRE